jgi:AraC-like DNA-binding protein
LVLQVRAAALTNYFEVARFCGLDPYRMLRGAHLAPESIADPDFRIPLVPAATLIEDCARQSRCPAFGLLMVESQALSNLGPISLLLEHEGTARDVINAFVRYQDLLCDSLAIGIDEAGGTAILRTELPAEAALPQAREFLTGLVCRTMCELANHRWHPESAHFVHAAPGDLAAHRRIFGCPLVFESDFNGLVCASAALEAPNPQAEAVLASYAQAYVERLSFEIADRSVGGRVRRALYLLLPVGRATLDQAAASLGLHPRALQRLLEAEGLTFATLLNDVRRELASRYLSGSHHNVATIAHMTGYASPSSFSRWFAAEFGRTPVAWRAKELAENVAAA